MNAPPARLPATDPGRDLAPFTTATGWVFDLDNTLYPRHTNLYAQVDQRIRDYVQRRLSLAPEEAERLRKDYYRRYGTTLRGLMVEHGISPDDFLEYVHDIDHSPIEPNPRLAAAIESLPGKKFILTNGSRAHADKVAARLGITGHFDDIVDIVRSELLPKPNRQTYDRFIQLTGIDASRTVIFEDLARNLAVPHVLGMTTVLVVPAGTHEVLLDDWELEGQDAAHVDFLTDNLTAFLERLLSAAGARMTIADSSLAATIDAAWERRDAVSERTKGEVREAVEAALDLLDHGKARVAEKGGGVWTVNQWLKKAVLLSFRLTPNAVIKGGPDGAAWWDKVPPKFAGWHEPDFARAGFRAVPGAIVRRSAYVAPGVILMPSFVNVGAYVDSGAMIDTWATVGSCAQIGKNVHLSGGVGIGGVLEPLQASPTIIEDNCFIGARSEVVEGVVVGEGAVLSMGVFIGASTKIVDRQTGEIHVGRVPPYAVVVAGSLPGKPLPGKDFGPSLYCAVIVKKVDAQTRAKTAINELLRD